jgi:haloalkane dehalogenase
VADIPLTPGHRSYPALARAQRDFPGLSEKPALLVWGLRDFVFGPAYLSYFRSALSGAKVLALPRSGHLPLEDEPQKALAAIKSFLFETVSQCPARPKS